jgi:pyruvate,water dikinase
VDVPMADQSGPSLLPPEVTALARFALQAERAFGSAMDMEWGVGPGKAGAREILLLQARPETVWAAAARNRRASASVSPLEWSSSDVWDNLHSQSEPGEHWSTSNFGEAIPGVSTPLSWSIWGPALESAMRGSVHAIGAFAAAEKELPVSRDQWYARSFFGRPALNVQYLATVGDRMPGTTGQAVVRDLLGRVPDCMTFKHTMRRYPIIAWRLPYTFFTIPGRVRRAATETTCYWQTSIAGVATMEQAAVVDLMGATIVRFRTAVTLQATLLLGSISPLYDALAGLVKKSGVGDTASLSGFGGAEIEVVSDLFRAAHGRLSIDDVVRRHGFHGPMEGELSSAVWREDPAPLNKLLRDYALRAEADDPRLHSERRRAAAKAVQRQMLAAMPLAARPLVWLLLKLAAKRIPMRGIPKRSFLQLFDVLRVCARRLGELLVMQGKLVEPDDVFYLTMEELSGELPGNARQLVALRRARRADYLATAVPADWQGIPRPVKVQAPAARGNSSVRGIGVSPGVIEGRARVLLQPDFGEVQAGEILVTPTTDPSWSSVMFISVGLVVDIGGALSHAAIVARELGIPCVVNTKNGSQILRTGDLLRVDGNQGTIEVLERAQRRVA